MLAYDLESCIVRGGRYHGQSAVSCRLTNKMKLASEPDKWVARIVKFMRENIISNIVYFWGVDPIATPEHEMSVLVTRLQYEKLFVIVETPGVLKSGLYTVFNYVIQVADLETMRASYVEQRKEVVVLIAKKDFTTNEATFDFARLRMGQPFVYLRPTEALDLQFVGNLVTKTRYSALNLPPLIVKKE